MKLKDLLSIIPYNYLIHITFSVENNATFSNPFIALSLSESLLEREVKTFNVVTRTCYIIINRGWIYG